MRTHIGTGESRPGTLPPPVWTRQDGPKSASSVALELHPTDTPVSRKMGARAEQAWLRARIAAAAASGEASIERSAAAALARTLAARGAELDTATTLAKRALFLGDDRTLREELSGWFAGLGEPALAAATLQPLMARADGSESARVLTRIAVLLARAGDARGASEALSTASRAAPSDPVPSELLGALGAWAPGAVDGMLAADAYLEGARRHETLGGKAAAFEDLLRACEMAPEAPVAAEKLAAALAARGRSGAGDEVMRAHAAAAGSRGDAVHIRRMRDAAHEGDFARALAAGLDARLERHLDVGAALRALGGGSEEDEDDERPLELDDVLARAGMYELLAARLELASETLGGRERARCRSALGKLYAGPLASSERAVDAYVDALVADPSSEEAKAALREHAATAHDQTPLVEALVRVGADDSADVADRTACLRELIVLAEQRLSDPALALWGVTRLVATGQDDDELRALAARLEPRVAIQDEALEAARIALATATGDERIDHLRRKASILRGRPAEVDRYVAVLVELVRLAPAERSWRAALERVLWRTRRFDDLVPLLRNEADHSAAPAEVEHARLGLAAAKHREGDLAAALHELEPLLVDGGAHRAAASMALLMASKLGDESARARALLRLAAPMPPAYRAMLSAVAAEVLLEVGETDLARAAAEQACHADPSLARPVAALAATALERRDRVGAAALERAMGVVVPRAAYCEALAATQEALGEPQLALAWTQRWLALRPGDPRAAVALLGRVTAAGDVARLGDALAWLLSQPQPLGSLAEPLGAALRRLAELDATRGGAVARRALDVFGPRVEVLRNAVLTVAELVGERGLAIATVERWLAAGAPGGDRADLLIDVSRRRKRAGDADGAARALARAIAEGASAGDVLAELDVALPARSSDGEISLLEARAEALSAASGADVQGTIAAWRELGAALWDLASDHDGAIRAWEHVAVLDPERGIERLAGDLVAFADSTTALQRLTDLAERRESPREGARVLAVAAHVALGSGQSSDALEIACRALELDPLLADVLAVAERAAGPADVDMLARAYHVIAEAALGVYGERAAHYRAARQFERRGAVERALRHAIKAFEAVPGEGVTFILMLRLGQRLGSSSEVVRAIERVAAGTENDDVRAAWLRRAAMVAGEGPEGQRQRVEVLLRALTIRPDIETLKSLGGAMDELAKATPDEADIVQMRFERALKALLARIDGPEGGRVAIEGAIGALVSFGNPGLAFDALTRALECDADIDEYARLAEPDHVRALTKADDRAQAFVLRCAALAEDKFANAGKALLELGAVLAQRLGEKEAHARLLVSAAKRDPEDQELVRDADHAARDVGDADLVEQIADAVPLTQRIASFREMAAEAEEAGDLPRAIASLERALDTEGIAGEDRQRVFDKLRDLYGAVGRRDALEALLTKELQRGDTEEEQRVRLFRDLSALIAARGEPERALDVLDHATREFPKQAVLYEDMVSVARQSHDRPRQADALGRLVDLTPSPAARLPLLKELAPLLDELGEIDPAAARWAEVLKLDPNDVGALSALERDAEVSGDYEQVVSLLARRASMASMVEDVRRIRLRRATVLEQRLGRPDEARAELEAVLAATGDHLGVLRVCADLNSRMSAPLRAAPLWFRASGLATNKKEAAELAERSVEAYLAGGDVDSARRVLEGMETWAQSDRLLQLRVDVERRSEDPRALAEALEDLALASMGAAKERAALLVEAARASEVAGDDASAVARAQRAARIAPEAAEPQLLAKLLEYRTRGAGNEEQARVTVAELRGIDDALDPDQQSLRAFLVAESLDVAMGAGAGMKELTRVHAETGTLPLVALGMAERLAEGPEPQRALSFFDSALGGNLRGLRRRGDVALAAARAARAAVDDERALGFVEIAVREEDAKAAALALRAEIRADRAPGTQPLPSTDETRASRPPRSARLSDPPPKPKSKRPKARSATPPPETKPLPSEPPPDESPEPPPVTSRLSSSPPADDSDEEEAPPSSGEQAPAAAPQRPGRRPGSMLFPPSNKNEATLLDAIGNGSVEAGRELIQQLENRAGRSFDLVVTARAVATLLPGDAWVLQKLYEAALADRDVVYARAVEHVLHAFDPRESPVEPPPLSAQHEQPDRVHALLFRESRGAAQEALEMVWDGAQHVFRRDPGTYGVTGLERVPFGSTSPIARVYTDAARLLDLTRTPLFQRRSAGAITVSVALLSPPAIILSGDVRRETAELRYHVGAMLAGTLPEHALLFGLPESQARNMFKGLLAAFGPPKSNATGLASIATLAEVLWETMPSRYQRRLRELCDEPDAMDYETALASARQGVRRGGLFVAGDLGVAVRETCAEEGISTKALDEPNGLAAVCAASPAIGDLVRLATSPEYADARWQPERERRRPTTGTWAKQSGR